MTFGNYVAKNRVCANVGCTNGVGRKRASYGHLVCKPCGEAQSLKTRSLWTIVQEYGKGGYHFVTATSAPTTLKQTNQKEMRG